MSTQEEIDIKIEQYLEGMLSPEEEYSFTQKIQQDPQLAQDIETYKTSLFLIKSKGVQEMKKQLESYSQHTHSKTLNPIYQQWYAWAACILILIGVIAYLYLPQNHKTIDQVFTAYYAPPMLDRQLLRDGHTSEKDDAFVAYQEGNYAYAFLQFEKFLKKEASTEIYFYASISALATDRTQKAILYLREVLKDKDTLYGWRSRWYLSLAYIKNNQIEEAKNILQELVTEENSYSKSAQELITALDFVKK